MSQSPTLSKTDGPTPNGEIDLCKGQTSTKNSSKKSEGLEEKCTEARGAAKELSDLCLPLECKLCCVKVDTPITAYTHYKGKPHLKKLKSYLWDREKQYVRSQSAPKLTSAFCNVCHVVLTSEIQALQHYSGKMHIKNMRQFKEEPGLGSGSTPGVPVEPVAMTISDQDPLWHPPENRYYCNLCCTTATSPEQLEIHKKGSRHIKRMRKCSSSASESQRDLSIYRTPSNQYYCPQCNITSNSPEQFIQHIDSRKHKRISRIKVHD